MSEKIIYCDNENLRYMGRIDFSQPKMPVFIWAGSMVKFRFKGTSLKIKVKNTRFFGENSIGAIIGGKEYKAVLPESDDFTIVTIAENLEDVPRETFLFKRQDATNYFQLAEIIIDGELMFCEELPKRKIECYGDSVCAGAVCEAYEYLGRAEPVEHNYVFDNAWHSFVMTAARNLGAQIHNNAQGGIAIFDGTGYYHAPDYIGMESAFDKLCYYPEGERGITEWDFSRYIPQLVIFEVGQNDSHCEALGDPDITNPEYRRRWKDGYKKIILALQEKYPKAKFVLLLTVLMHDGEWDKAVEEIANELNENVEYFRFSGTGAVTPGHPRIQEHVQMAEELTAHIINNKLLPDV